jgi:hypothetical protein
MPRIECLTVHGFRAFGTASPPLDLTAPVSVIWGPNSQGKTSLAEAIEFLLTGSTVRCEILSSSVDEFAETLRNVHLPLGTPTFVEANIVGSDGARRKVRRTLTRDYAKKARCESELTIDGAKAETSNLEQLGIRFGAPPLAVPVLLQHTLGYLFTARPQDRSFYFKALLEVTDLEAMRSRIANYGEACLRDVAVECISQLKGCAAKPELSAALTPLLDGRIAIQQTDDVLSDASASLLEKAGEAVPATADERFKTLLRILENRRSATFPLEGFDRKTMRDAQVHSAIWGELERFKKAVGKLTEEARRLATLYEEALRVTKAPRPS